MKLCISQKMSGMKQKTSLCFCVKKKAGLMTDRAKPLSPADVCANKCIQTRKTHQPKAESPLGIGVVEWGNSILGIYVF
jgi:hypothetical protein